MKTSDAERYGYTCPVPECRGALSRDLANKGFVRHLHRKPDGTKCMFGQRERDEEWPGRRA
jgi:hypothetical protein